MYIYSYNTREVVGRSQSLRMFALLLSRLGGQRISLGPSPFLSCPLAQTMKGARDKTVQALGFHSTACFTPIPALRLL